MKTLTITNDDRLSASDRAYAAIVAEEETMLGTPHIWLAIEDADGIASIMLDPYRVSALMHWLSAWCEAHPTEVQP